MQNPEFDVHEVKLIGEDKLFLDLTAPYFIDGERGICPYRLKHLIPKDEETAYAVYEADHNIVAVQFYIGSERLTFGDNEQVYFMTMDEIRLIRELGEVAIDGISYSLVSMIFNIVDGEMGCQRMLVLNISEKTRIGA